MNHLVQLQGEQNREQKKGGEQNKLAGIKFLDIVKNIILFTYDNFVYCNVTWKKPCKLAMVIFDKKACYDGFIDMFCCYLINISYRYSSCTIHYKSLKS